jgi:hypothetical protein
VGGAGENGLERNESVFARARVRACCAVPQARRGGLGAGPRRTCARGTLTFSARSFSFSASSFSFRVWLFFIVI